MVERCCLKCREAGRSAGYGFIQTMTEMVMMIIGAVRQGMGGFGMVGCRVSQGRGRLVGHEMGSGETSTMAWGCRQYD